MNRENCFGAPLRHDDVPQRLNDIATRVIGAAIEVHRHLGPGFLERTYEEALAIELRLRGIRFARQVPMSVEYKDQVVTDNNLDLLVEDELVVELKASIESFRSIARRCSRT